MHAQAFLVTNDGREITEIPVHLEIDGYDPGAGDRASLTLISAEAEANDRERIMAERDIAQGLVDELGVALHLANNAIENERAARGAKDALLRILFESLAERANDLARQVEKQASEIAALQSQVNTYAERLNKAEPALTATAQCLVDALNNRRNWQSTAEGHLCSLRAHGQIT